MRRLGNLCNFFLTRQGIEGKHDWLSGESCYQLTHDCKFAGLLVVHHVQVQHDSRLLGERCYGGDKTLARLAVITQGTFDAFAIDGHPRWLDQLDQHLTPVIEQL